MPEFNPNPNQSNQIPAEQHASLEEYAKNERKRSLKGLLVGLLVAVIGVAGYFGYQNPQLFLGAITEVGAPASAGQLYIPEYTAAPGDEGLIAVKSNVSTATDVHSVQFTLNYQPVDALTFNENSIVFDSGTLFQTAELKSVDTSTAGQATVTFFANNPVTLPTGQQTLVKLSTKIKDAIAPGTEISMNVSNVEVVVPDGPDGFESSTALAAITGGKITISSDNKLKVLKAVPADDSHVLVYFSDFIQNVGTPANFSIEDSSASALAVNGLSLGDNQKTLELETATQTAGEKFTVTVSGSDVKGNTQGSLNPDPQSAIFYGFDAAASVSPVELSTIDVNSATEVVLSFSTVSQIQLDEETVTPLNIDLTTFDGGTPSELTIQDINVENVSGKPVVTLATAKQAAGATYYVTFNGVQDANGDPIGNEEVLSFFGYTVPAVSINNIQPGTVTNDTDKAVNIVGANLDTITEARLGNQTLQITDQSSGALSIVIPKGTSENTYNLTLVNSAGETTVKEDAILVQAPLQPLRVVSDASKATPNRVAPDGETTVKLWVLVEDPVDVSAVDSVTINLEDIGGSRAQEMQKDTGTQSPGRQWYVYETTVDPITPTKDTPYELPVEARKGSQVATGTVELTVTKDILQSVAPTIDQVYFSPVSSAPDGETPVKISAKITDEDGAETITSVVADLGPLGAGFVNLNRLDVAGTANEQVSGWFESEEFVVANSVTPATYEIEVTASDATGEETSKEVQFQVNESSLNAPKIDRDRSYISPHKTVPKDGKTPFNVFVTVEDPDGLGDISSVVADFISLGLSPISLERSSAVSDSDKRGFYSAEGLTVPKNAPLGVHEIEVVATDQSGSKASMVLKLEVSDIDVIGDPPIIVKDRVYTTPKVAVNDGETPFSLHAFVRDGDDDIESVIVNLTSVGQQGKETANDFGEKAETQEAGEDGACPTGSRTIVCLKPSVKEGNDGRWFVISGLTISQDTAASSEPYMVEVIATDMTGKTDREMIPISVFDGERYTNDKNPPRILAAVATGTGEVEVVFNEELAATSVSPSGEEFTIADRRDVSKELEITNATIDATGRVVTLTTGEQVPEKSYVLTASSKITDAVGVPLSAGTGNRVSFTGFVTSQRTPIVDYVSVIDSQTLEIEFRNPVRPSSLVLGTTKKNGQRASLVGGANFNIEIFADETNRPLEVQAVNLKEGAKVLEVKTAQQQSDRKYRLVVKGVESAAGNARSVGTTKFFKGFRTSVIQKKNLSHQADLNGDGRVDFTDFTMFSAVYGQAFNTGSSENQSQDLPGAPELQPIVPEPDATVPTTSEPSGGETPTSETTTDEETTSNENEADVVDLSDQEQ